MRAVCATDLSAASEAAIENETCLECLGRIGVEEMHLVTVIASNVHRGMPGIDFEKRRKRALSRYRSVVEDAGFDVETHVVRGTPHRRINGVANAVGADLTIVGSRGESPLANRVIGSTARNLARTTIVPLFINRIERETADPAVIEQHLFQRMLFATDFSEHAAHAFDIFSSLHHATEEVLLVHVQTPQDPDPGETGGAERLASLAAELEEWGIDTQTEIRHGDPAAEILAAETDYEPATILLGSRGHSRLRRLLLGSVPREIVTKSGGNVLLVPPERAR